MITSYEHSLKKDIKITPKQKAQEALLLSMQIAFVRLMDGGSTDINEMTKREQELVWDQMDKQMARVEKLFGYEQNTWPRGC